MITIAEKHGFKVDHIGCPCTGSPRVMIRREGVSISTLTIWTKRNVWRLQSKGYTIGTGNKDNLESKLNEYGFL